VSEDFEEQEVENFMEELGVYDGDSELDSYGSTDPTWSTPLGIQVYSYLLGQKKPVFECWCIWMF